MKVKLGANAQIFKENNSVVLDTIIFYFNLIDFPHHSNLQDLIDL